MVAGRLLAAAEAALPADSLVLAHALQAVISARLLPSDGEGNSYGVRLAAWRAEPALTLEPSRRCAALLATRAAARTLFVLQPHESAWLRHADGALSVDTLLAMSALEALTYWPAELRAGAELRAAVTTALRAGVESLPHGYAAHCAATDCAYRPDVAGDCYALGVLATWCRCPDIAPHARAVCDDTCLDGLRVKLLGRDGEHMPPPARTPPHLRFLLEDAAEAAAPARAAHKVAIAASKTSAAASAPELAAAHARVAPLVECVNKLRRAEKKGNVTAQRAAAAALVALAEASLPPDSLVLAHALQLLSGALDTPLATPMSVAEVQESCTAAWHDGDPQLQAARRCATILLARCEAHTLLVLRPDEEAWMAAQIGQRSPYYVLVSCASQAAKLWPPALRAPGAQGATLLAAAVRALVHAHAHEFSMRLTRDTSVTIRLTSTTASMCGRFFEVLQQFDLLPLVLGSCDEAAVHALGSSLLSQFQSEPLFSNLPEQLASHVEKLTARVAAHGLRPCALPACGAMEPHPQAFKLCARCKAAKYCCQEHQVEDWKRHKREDNCRRAGNE